MALTHEQLSQLLVDNLTWALEHPEAADALAKQREDAITPLQLAGTNVTPPPLNDDGSLATAPPPKGA